MRKSIGQELYLYRSNMGILAAVSAVSWLAGILGMMVFQQLTKSGEALFPIGTVMLFGVGGILSLFVLANIVPHNFDLAVSMGKTRKHYLPAAVCVMKGTRFCGTPRGSSPIRAEGCAPMGLK